LIEQECKRGKAGRQYIAAFRYEKMVHASYKSKMNTRHHQNVRADICCKHENIYRNRKISSNMQVEH